MAELYINDYPAQHKSPSTSESEPRPSTSHNNLETSPIETK